MILTVHLKPGSKCNAIEWIDEDTLKIWVKEPPREGKANAALIQLLCEELGVTKSEIQIVRGAKTRIKQVKISKNSV